MSRSDSSKEPASEQFVEHTIEPPTAARNRFNGIWTPDMPKPSWYRERPPHPEDTDKYEPDYNKFNDSDN